jgi:hypothetical protein
VTTFLAAATVDAVRCCRPAPRRADISADIGMIDGMMELKCLLRP